MVPSIRRLSVALFATVALVGTTLVGVGSPANAAQPLTGQYHYRKVAPGSAGMGVTQIDFSVAKVGSKLKVKNFAWTGYSCGTLTVGKALTVNNKGKFKFEGQAQSAGTARIEIKVKGKFKTKKKAKVSIDSIDANYECGTVSKVTVKRKD